MMFDDGAHNDGAANDDVYGVEVQINAAKMQYYFYLLKSLKSFNFSKLY